MDAESSSVPDAEQPGQEGLAAKVDRPLHGVVEVRVAPGVLSQEVGDETVLLEPASGRYFGLDAVGSEFWRLLRGLRRLDRVVDEMAAFYDAPRDRLAADLDALVQELADRKLVEITDPAQEER